MVKYRIELDTVKRWTGPETYTTMQRATCGNEQIEGNGFIVREMCKILASNSRPLEGLVEVYRGDVPCFTVVTLKQWLNGV